MIEKNKYKGIESTGGNHVSLSKKSMFIKVTISGLDIRIFVNMFITFKHCHILNRSILIQTCRIMTTPKAQMKVIDLSIKNKWILVKLTVKIQHVDSNKSKAQIFIVRSEKLERNNTKYINLIQK